MVGVVNTRVGGGEISAKISTPVTRGCKSQRVQIYSPLLLVLLLLDPNRRVLFGGGDTERESEENDKLFVIVS